MQGLKIFNSIIAALILSFAFSGCEEPYSPPAINASNNYLVVEGTICSGTTTFRLTRSSNLSKPNKNNFVSDAKVHIESTSNETYNLSNKDSGYYELKGLVLNQNQKYRLKIEADGKEYVSEYAEVKSAPAIGDITWESQPDGVQLFVNTSDPSGKARFYRWEYEETWQFHSALMSTLIFKDSTKYFRTPEEDIYECFASARSNGIYLGTPLSPKSTEIIHQPLIKLTLKSTRLQMLYSILVKQNVIDEKEFEYWQNLKKMTESVGTIFDPQPAQYRGNIKCTSNDSELVLGYVSASNSSEKRIFIDRANLPSNYILETEYDGCNVYEEDSRTIYGYKSGTYVPINSVTNMETGKVTYYYGFVTCIDCRRNGTQTKPDYWPL
ncbi:DUF4249 domain-containing protein [Sporocytophaga myxococcoides]|uniref:DUF4249 domain-containing protein n=1 Tax=Sporocytophaga myxococcoides TaxID=153721 RepID=UPI0004090406|nr:DUF4249 domain-containing protein [Sporocytophaga myxococcoides]